MTQIGKKRTALLVNVLAGAYAFAYWLQIRTLRAREVVVVNLLLIIFAVLSVLQIGKGLVELRRLSADADPEVSRRPDMSFGKFLKNKSFLLIVLTIAYIAVFPLLGFYVTTFLFLTTANVLLGTRNKLVLTLLPVGMLAFIYVVFTLLFRIRLPSGILL
mgnify:CR=1 FL=1